MNKNALILFLRYPEQGVVKTRLAKTLGEDFTYELYTCFLADLAVMVHEVEAEKVIVYSGPEDAVFSSFPELRLILQRGNDIGERMYSAFSDVFALGFERAILIGSDCPDLPARLVNDAFEKLAVADVVFGPGTDGGYYLVGCNRDGLCPSIFSGVPWSTDAVFSETLQRAAETGLVCGQLEKWSDIDEIDDLKQFYMRNANRAVMCRTMKILNTSGIIHER